jgi:hypothetical protein
MSEAAIDTMIQRFVQHDEAMLNKQQAVTGTDWDETVKISFKARAELEHILEGDAAQPNTKPT